MACNSPIQQPFKKELLPASVRASQDTSASTELRLSLPTFKDEVGQSVCKDLGLDVATFVHCDVAKESDVETAINIAISLHGKLDIMVNNAAVGKGSIISLGSVCSSVGGVGSHAYTSSKHAIIGLTKNVAAELGRFGIRVNRISPYFIATPLSVNFFNPDGDDVFRVYSNLKGVVLLQQDVAEAALYLGSDESKNVSGHNLALDGGFTTINPAFDLFSSSQ
ncbi:hypothetical protein PTKIN_Ptkin10aG0087200 [Pterospermum kingtungense]